MAFATLFETTSRPGQGHRVHSVRAPDMPLTLCHWQVSDFKTKEETRCLLKTFELTNVSVNIVPKTTNSSSNRLKPKAAQRRVTSKQKRPVIMFLYLALLYLKITPNTYLSSLPNFSSVITCTIYMPVIG